MKQRVVIIGAGISGVMTAYILHSLDPQIELTLFDAGPEPKFSDRGGNSGHHGATLGYGRDARHFTGTEGLSFQNPIHTKLLFEMADEASEGWQTIPENELTAKEKSWRQECIDRYHRDVTAEYNPYDQMYTTLNYGGMAGWKWLMELQPELSQFCISRDWVYVAFYEQKDLWNDLKSETSFNPLQKQQPVTRVEMNTLHEQPEKVIAVEKIAPQLLKLPGLAWQIQSCWKYLYNFLGSQPNVEFHWDAPVRETESVGGADAYVWAAGSLYVSPEIYNQHSRVQGIGGWWVTVPNPGFSKPFKFSAPQPSGYLNFTPNSELLHISGGFGWVGERGYAEAEQLLQPAKKHFLEDVGLFLKMSVTELENLDAGCCIRPTTPTGLPDIAVHQVNDKPHIMISGAGKAGATQAPLLALYVAEVLGIRSKFEQLFDSSKSNSELITAGLKLLQKGFEPEKTTSSSS